MSPRIVHFVWVLAFIAAACQSESPPPGEVFSKALFDGLSLDGWEGAEGFFRVENGTIIGGSLSEGLDENQYLCTTEEYADFELSLEAKLIQTDLNGNSGVVFRAKRRSDSPLLESYQADIGYIEPGVVAFFSGQVPADTTQPYSLWGSLLDEGRMESPRYPHPDVFPVAVLNLPDRQLVREAVRVDDWNELVIHAVGKRIRIIVNGVVTTDFTDTLDLPEKGCIGLQAHSGDPYEVHFRNIRITELKAESEAS